YPAIASDSVGNFIVAWLSGPLQDSASYGVFGQRFFASGAPCGAEFRINSYTTSSQTLPAVARDSAGAFVVVWGSYGQDGSRSGVFAQRYDSSGGTVGTEWQVNAYTTDEQRNPRVALDGGGNFVVVWNGKVEDGSGYGVFGQRFSSSGSPLGGEF